MRSLKSRMLSFVSLLLVLGVLFGPSAQAAGEPIDYSMRGLNEEFYTAFTELLSSQDTSSFFGTIQMRIGETKLVKDGEEQFLDAAPEITGGRTMLPIRAVAEAAGMRVAWDDATRTITIRDAYEGKVTASIGSDVITVNGEAWKMDVTPYINSSGHSFFPLRAISEALNLDVVWDSGMRTVTITAPYQTARLLIMTNDNLRGKAGNATSSLYDGAGMWILQFSTPSEARETAKTLRSSESGYQPEPDIYVVTRSAESEWVYDAKQDSWGALDSHFAQFAAEYGERFQDRVTVAVVDTGVDTSHPDLQGRLRPGRDFVENDNEPEDEDSHGTHVAATILDCVGGAPVDILPVRVVAGDNASSSSRLSLGIKYAADRYAKIINISLGGALDAEYQFSEGQKVLDSAIQYAVRKGAVVVVSAGNDGADTMYYCPANIDSAGVVVVSAGDETHARWPQSNYGNAVDLMAPGTNIIAAVPGGGYAAKTGTSMAAPHVSAAAALLYLSSGNSLKPGALEKALRSATESGTWKDAYEGYGFLDLSKGSAPEYRPPKAFENVLMPDRCVVGTEDASAKFYVFGSEIERRKIASVTFLDSKAGMPAEHWDVSEAQNGSVVAWVTPAENGVLNGMYDLVIAADGVIGAPADCSRMFYGYGNASSINFNSVFDTANVTDMSLMFRECRNLLTLDLGGFDTANVTDMSEMFHHCSNLTELNVGGFDTANVTDMTEMFSNCSGLAELDISGWDTANVTSMCSMFSSCRMSFLDVSGWNTSNVTDMSYMFFLSYTIEELDVSGWDTTNVTNMRALFAGCRYLTELDVSGWDTAKVTDMNGVFSDCELLTELDVGGWNTAKVTDMSSMFLKCYALTTVDVSGFDTANVTNMEVMFDYCPALTALDVSGWDTANVTNMRQMFYGCRSLTELDVSGWDTAKVTNIKGMFEDCRSLTALDVSGFDTANVTDMWGVFKDCPALTALDVSGWNISNITNMGSMFRGCASLKKLNVAGWDTTGVTDMRYLFSDCVAVTELDIAGWDTSSVTNMEYMFSGCAAVMELDVASWDTSKAVNMEHMFEGCSNLTALEVGGFDTSKVTGMSSMFSGCSGLTSLEVGGFDTTNVTGMSSMFSGCSGLTSLEVGGFDTSKVTEMSFMFSGCSGLTALDVSGFDTSLVTSMDGVFDGCDSLTGLDTSGWDTSKYRPAKFFENVLMPDKEINLNPAFAYKKFVFGSEIYRYEVASVTFLDTKADMPVEHWDVSEAQNDSVVAWATQAENGLYDLFIAADGVIGAPVDCSNMFRGYRNAVSISFNDHFDTANVTSMSQMFDSCASLTSLDISSFNTRYVTNMVRMFFDCAGLRELDIGGWDTSSVTELWGIFNGCSGLTALDIGGWDISNVTSISNVFWKCSGLTALDIGGWDTSNVTYMERMFNGCSSLTELDIGGWDTSKVTGMDEMFGGCSSLTELDIDGWDTSNVTSMVEMFNDCSSLTKLGVSGWDTANVTYMMAMFNGCSSLTALDIGGWDTSNVTYMERMFNGCSSLTELDIGGWNTSRANVMGNMFTGCTGLHDKLDLSGWDTSNVFEGNEYTLP